MKGLYARFVLWLIRPALELHQRRVLESLFAGLQAGLARSVVVLPSEAPKPERRKALH